ncbi:DUF4834 family protein [Gaetbulibacter aestuarii]|uniref:DUF4834 family protein n=1 Tax=Gaetbulibacter aestuarii TaxID=1502358 RepID=A0ABW7N3K4_9FLAO
MQYASATGLVRMILIIMLVYFGIKILSRLFAPVLMRFVAKKAEEQFGGRYEQNQREAPKKEGEVTIDKMPNQRKASSDEVGDYIDYEEIE